MTVRLGGLRRGVAQPGRAPGSGPGGRRFKSSLPDHLFSIRYAPSKVLKILAVGKNATVLTSQFSFGEISERNHRKNFGPHHSAFFEVLINYDSSC